MLHKFEFDEIKIVLDVNSGAVHIADQLVWDLLEDCRHMGGWVFRRGTAHEFYRAAG